jgi:hypothetical protein
LLPSSGAKTEPSNKPEEAGGNLNVSLSLLPTFSNFLLGSLFDPEDGGSMFSEMSGCLKTVRSHNPEDSIFIVTAMRTKNITLPCACSHFMMPSKSKKYSINAIRFGYNLNRAPLEYEAD